MEKIRIRDQGSRMEKIWIRDGKNSDQRSGINIPDQQNWKSRRQICQDLQNRIIFEPFVEKAFWDETKSFLQSKAASVALKRGKTPVNWIFQSSTRHRRCHRTTSPGAKPLLQLTFIRPQQRFIALKKPSPPLFSITGCGKSSVADPGCLSRIPDPGS